MARTQDRWIISEVIRKQSLWEWEGVAHGWISLVTIYDERLRIQYGRVGQVVSAIYTHWDRDTGVAVSEEVITKNKRKRVLELINQKDVG